MQDILLDKHSRIFERIAHFGSFCRRHCISYPFPRNYWFNDLFRKKGMNPNDLPQPTARVVTPFEPATEQQALRISGDAKHGTDPSVI